MQSARTARRSSRSRRHARAVESRSATAEIEPSKPLYRRFACHVRYPRCVLASCSYCCAFYACSLYDRSTIRVFTQASVVVMWLTRSPWIGVVLKPKTWFGLSPHRATRGREGDLHSPLLYQLHYCRYSAVYLHFFSCRTAIEGVCWCPVHNIVVFANTLHKSDYILGLHQSVSYLFWKAFNCFMSHGCSYLMRNETEKAEIRVSTETCSPTLLLESL